ncbi:MAG: tRNA lysidine(34) synthetase TilS [Deltaproteobacteria bacterium]|jgi:tRNA(Ile)-lysidine synthase|nr:tRNA lysidine(34) synthetase TilS [Deltaproteobacteria bacterium]
MERVDIDNASLEVRFFKALTALDPRPNLKYVCAYSAGPDSTALLALLLSAVPAKQVFAAHLDHNLRDSSAAEAQKAQEWAEDLGVKVILGSVDVKALASQRGRGLEDAARFARYEFLAQTLSTVKGDYIVTGHQANDQAETILLKLLRGGGPTALIGVKRKNGAIIRPLLDFTREELLSYLKIKGLSYLNDPSNQDLAFRRNRLRLNIWPEIVKLNENAASALARAADLAVVEEEYWESLIADWDQQYVTLLPSGRIQVLASGLRSLPLAAQRRFILHILRRATPNRGLLGDKVSFAGVNGVISFLAEDRINGSGRDLPGGFRVERQGIHLHIGPNSRINPKSRPE